MARTWRRALGAKKYNRVKPVIKASDEYWASFPGYDDTVKAPSHIMRDNTWRRRYIDAKLLKNVEARRKRKRARLCAQEIIREPEKGEADCFPTNKRMTVRWHFWIY